MSNSKHIADPSFEKDYNPFQTLERLRKPIGAEDFVSSHFTVQRLFECQFGIFDHTDPNLVYADPLAVIRAKKEENFSVVSHLDDVTENYAKAQIKDRFGLTWVEYINLPIPIANKLNTLAFEVMGRVEIEKIKAQNQAREEQMKKAEEDGKAKKEEKK